MQGDKIIKQRIKILDLRISKLPTEKQLLDNVMKAIDNLVSDDIDMDSLVTFMESMNKHQILQCKKMTLKSVLKDYTGTISELF